MRSFFALSFLTLSLSGLVPVCAHDHGHGGGDYHHDGDHWNNHYSNRVYVNDAWYHPDHVYYNDGYAYPNYYNGSPYYYYDPRWYYDGAPGLHVNINVP